MNKLPQDIDFPAILASSVHDMKNALGLMLSTFEEFQEECGKNHSPPCCHVHKLVYDTERVNYSLIQLLTLYRIGSDKYLPQIEEQNVFETMEDVYLQNNQVAEAFEVQLEFGCEDDLLTWNFDSSLVNGVVNSILNNGLRYSKSKMRLSAYEENQQLVLMVEDDGDGYPQELLDTELATSVNFETGSTGLGLYFARVIAELHHCHEQYGSVRIDNESSLGGGRFTLFLP